MSEIKEFHYMYRGCRRERGVINTEEESRSSRNDSLCLAKLHILISIMGLKRKTRFFKHRFDQVNLSTQIISINCAKAILQGMCKFYL